MGANSKIQLPPGVIKSAANKSGVEPEEWITLRKIGMKWCYCCQRWLHKENFGIDKTRGDGRANHCKECNSAKGTASRYGISIIEARKLRGGKQACEICGRIKPLEVDHDHDTGEIRGFLCSGCNSALGLMKDDPELIKKCIEYLENHVKNKD